MRYLMRDSSGRTLYLGSEPPPASACFPAGWPVVPSSPMVPQPGLQPAALIAHRPAHADSRPGTNALIARREETYHCDGTRRAR